MNPVAGLALAGYVFRMNALRSLGAWFLAALAGSALGAALTALLVLSQGLPEWGFLAQLWFWLTAVGFALAFVGGGVAAALALLAAKRFDPPRPLSDMAAGALVAFAILMGVRAFVFAQMEEPPTLPDFGLILIVPLIAGAVAGLVYWRLRPRGVARTTTATSS